MSRAPIFSPELLAQHIAVLGKTGSGKTSTSKLLIEQVVAQGARVCVLDPIKSDWWGLTSSAHGKQAGLPFHILGGPHGHVPLHSSAGKAVADIVASGALPLSVIDMAEFEPGGQARFFTEFAPALLRKMRGVVYLVIEEAHLFAPKERSGIGAENLSIHWAKTMATAGRSKGIRLVLATQRTQALHNALLGSCDTMIAHRLTAPADQEPVVKWLKANTSKDVLERVASSLSSLKTGQGWICSGEAKQFELITFPRIATYDNTATPTGDGEMREVKTAAVDRDKLRSIIGDAVAEAEANDPKKLRQRIAELERAKSTSVPAAAPAKEIVREKIVEKVIVTDAQLGRLEKLTERIAAAEVRAFAAVETSQAGWREVTTAVKELTAAARAARSAQPEMTGIPAPVASRALAHATAAPAATSRVPARTIGTPHGGPASAPKGDGAITGPMRKILNELATWDAIGVHEIAKAQLGLMCGYTNVRSGGFTEPLAALVAAGLAENMGAGVVRISVTGRDTADPQDTPQSSTELQERILAKLSGPQQRIARALLNRYPESIDKATLGESLGYTNVRSGGFTEPLAYLVSLGMAEYPTRGHVAASPRFFLPGGR